MPAFGTLLLFLAALGQNPAADSHALAGLRLQDFRGASFALDDVRERKLVVLAFLGVECPLANQYAPRLVELARSFEPKGVAFFAIDANQQDGATVMGRFAKANDLPFPFLKDVGNELADQLERRADAGGPRARREASASDTAAASTTSSRSAFIARHRRAATWPSRSTSCWPGKTSPLRRRNRSAAGSAGSADRARAR